MSDYATRPALGGGEASSRGAARGAARGASKSERVLASALVATAALTLIAGVFLLVPPALRVTRYEITGNSTMTREELLSAALIHEKEYFFSLDAARVKAAVEAEPRVASARVTKIFPNGLRIAVTERVAAAVALVDLEGRPTAVCFDAEGVAFAAATSKEAAAVPVISGLRFEGFRLGARLPPSLAGLLASIGSIGAAEPGLLSAISEIKVVAALSARPAQGEVSGPIELLLYPLNQRIPVRVGASLDAPTLRSIILVLDVLGTKGLAASVQELDFRTGTVVYRSKEGQSG